MSHSRVLTLVLFCLAACHHEKKPVMVPQPAAPQPTAQAQQPPQQAVSTNIAAGDDLVQKCSLQVTQDKPTFDFNHFEPKAPTAKVKATSECAYCHMAGAKKDQVWTQFYRLLDK